jgi:hypothetical protein
LKSNDTSDKAGAITKVNAKCNGLTLIKDKELSAFGVKPRNKEQVMAMSILLDDEVKLVSLIGRAGSGKAQPLDALVLTAKGYKPMGEILPGEQVAGSDGEFHSVTGVYPQGIKDIYTVKFSDNTSTECCLEHLWAVKSDKDRKYGRDYSIKSLDQIRDALVTGKYNRKNFSIPQVEPIKFAKKDLPLSPYLMGALIGDGHLDHQINISNIDNDVLERVNQELEAYGCKLGLANRCSYNIVRKDKLPWCTMTAIDQFDSSGQLLNTFNSRDDIKNAGFNYFNLKKATKSGKPYKGFIWKNSEKAPIHNSNQVKEILKKVKLFGYKAEAKFIPKEYLHSSIEDRVAMMQGLMDTDGTISKSGMHTYLSTSSPQLRDDFQFLLESLGAKVTVASRLKPRYTYKGEKRTGKVNYRITFSLPPGIQPFFMKAKAELFKPRSRYLPRRFITSIDFAGKKEAQCISVDAPNHLYITNNFIVTHNTLLAISAALQKMQDKKYDRIILTRVMSQVGNHDLGALPGGVQEKFGPYLENYITNIQQLTGNNRNTVQDIMAMYKMEVIPLQLVRGASWVNSLVIFDETQNATKHEMLTLGTRIGEGSKLIVMGDLEQRDEHMLKPETGLYHLVNSEKIKSSELTAHIELIKSERSPLAQLVSEAFEED